MTPVAVLWSAFVAVWAGTQLWYGAVTSEAIAATAAALAALVAAAEFVLPAAPGPGRAAKVFLAGLVFLFAVQLTPGLGFLFPWSAALRARHGVAGAWPGTADVFFSVRQFAQIACYVLSSLLVLRLIRAGLTRRVIATSIVAVLALQAAYALVQVGIPLKDIPFFGPRPYPDSASGTLVNRNSFGGLMAMAFPFAAALAWETLTARRRGHADARREYGWLWALAAALFAAAVVASRSRGGALAALAGAGTLLVVARRRGRAGQIVAAAALAACAAVTVLAANAEPLLERFGTLEGRPLAEDVRPRAWRATLSAVPAQPVLGYGIGTFPASFAPFQPPDLPGHFDHAHSEYVNALFEGGAAFLLLLLAGLALWTRTALRTLPTLEGPERFTASAAIAAVAAAAVHALVDFDLRITSDGILFATALAVALPRSAAPAARAVPLTAAALALAAAATLAFAPLNPEPAVARARVLDPARAEISLARTLALSPCDAPAAWTLARTANRRGDTDLADQRFRTAADLWPSHPDVQREAGLWFWEAPARRADAAACLRRYLTQRPDRTRNLLELLYSPEEPVATWDALAATPLAAAHIAAFLVRANRWNDADALFRRHVPASRENFFCWDIHAHALMEAGQWGLEALARESRLAVKSDATGHALAAHAWLRLGVPVDAERNARICTRIDPGRPDWQILLADALEAKGDGMAATEALTSAIGAEPGNLDLKKRRARLFAHERMYLMAAEDYRDVIAGRPDDRGASIELAFVLIEAGLKTDAEKALRDHEANFPDDPEPARLRREFLKR